MSYLSEQMRSYSPPAVGIVLVALVAAGCGKLTEAKETVEDPPTAEDVKNKVVEKYDCSGVGNESTRELVGDAVAGRDLKKLATSPNDLARITAGAAVTTDTTALMAGNIGQVTRRQHVRQAIAGQWSSLECGANESKTCEDALSERSGGTFETSVQCDGDGDDAKSVRGSFGGECRLFGTENSGAVEVPQSGNLVFQSLGFGAARVVDGQLGVELQSDDVRRFELQTGDELAITSQADKSCEKTTTVERLVGVDTDEKVEAGFEAARTSGGDTVRTRTLQEERIRWDKPMACSCPTSGTVEVRHSDPVGLGEPGTVRLSYSEGGDDTCASVSADIVSWPEGCEGAESCGRETLESLTGELVTASCSPLTSME